MSDEARYLIMIAGPGVKIRWRATDAAASKILTLLFSDGAGHPIEDLEEDEAPTPEPEESPPEPRRTLNGRGRRPGSYYPSEDGFELNKSLIRERLKELGLSQANLIRRANQELPQDLRISPRSTSTYLAPSAYSTPSVEVCRAWAKVLGYPDALDILAADD